MNRVREIADYGHKWGKGFGKRAAHPTQCSSKRGEGGRGRGSYIERFYVDVSSNIRIPTGHRNVNQV